MPVGFSLISGSIRAASPDLCLRQINGIPAFGSGGHWPACVPRALGAHGVLRRVPYVPQEMVRQCLGYPELLSGQRLQIAAVQGLRNCTDQIQLLQRRKLLRRLDKCLQTWSRGHRTPPFLPLNPPRGDDTLTLETERRHEQITHRAVRGTTVGKPGLEPGTSRTRTVRASHLRYSPNTNILYPLSR